MNSVENFGKIESEKFDASSLAFREKMLSFNKNFTSKLTPENGIYGVTEVVKANGVIERLGQNEFGHKVKEYVTSEGQLFKRRELLGNGCNATTLFDDNGVAYLRKVTKLGDGQAKVLSSKLAPEVTITKGNFTATTDAYGRPVLNKVTDLSIKNSPRESLSSINRDNAYRATDHRGHLIPDNFGGPASQENVVAQLGEINQGKVAQVENIVRDLKAQGHKVDYEVKSNYTDSKSTRPSSFEAKITVDGKEYTDLPDNLRKIYNESDADLTTAKKIKINAGEKFGIANEMGIKSGLIAGGLTMAVSTVDNVSSYIDGEISAEDMVVDIVEDTAVAGAMGYGTAFVSTAVSQAMSKSSSALISKVGGSCLPAAVVAFGVESYEDISDYAKGEIDGTELAYNLGENAAGVAGGFVGGAMVGATVGTVAGPVGTVAGTIVGGVVGCVIAAEAYATAVEYGTEGADILADKTQELASNVIDCVAENAPEVLDDVKGAFNEFAGNAKLPFSFA